MKVHTVEQFKLLQFTKSNFDMAAVTVSLVAPDCLKISDSEGACVLLTMMPDGNIDETYHLPDAGR